LFELIVKSTLESNEKLTLTDGRLSKNQKCE